MIGASVQQISRQDTKPFLLGIHYARRMPSVSFAFGLFLNGNLDGVVTYGTPPSAPLRGGVCGPDFAKNVIELNRLCLKANRRNEASFLVSKSLRLLGGNRIVISFADTSMGHSGTVYQASNFLYCGLSAKRTDWKVRGKEHLHGQTIADEFRGLANRAAAMREKYGADFYLEPRPRKHRYIRLLGSRKFRKESKNALRYDPQPYPPHTSLCGATGAAGSSQQSRPFTSPRPVLSFPGPTANGEAAARLMASPLIRGDA